MQSTSLALCLSLLLVSIHTALGYKCRYFLVPSQACASISRSSSNSPLEAWCGLNENDNSEATTFGIVSLIIPIERWFQFHLCETHTTLIYIYLSLNILSNGYIYLPSCEHWFVDKWLPQVRWLVLQYNFRLQHEIDHHGKMTVLDICSCLLVAMKMSWPRKRRSQFNPMALVDSTQLVSSLLELETLLNSWQRKPSFSTNHIEIWFALSVIWRTKYSNKPLGCR